MQIEDLLQKLIDIPSLTGEEQALADFLDGELRAQGLLTKHYPVDGRRANFFAGFNVTPEIILTTHLDTVPPFIPCHLENGCIYGRGACDAKGSMAAMIHALLTVDIRFREKVGLLFVVGEETDSIGAKSVEKTDLRPNYFINGEPTNNQLVKAQKGTMIFRLRAKGIPCHSGYPNSGQSAIDKLLVQLQRFKTFDWPNHPQLGETTFNIGQIQGGEAANSLAAHAEAVCSLRVTSNCQSILAQIQPLLTEDVTFEIITASEPLKLFVPENYSSEVVSFGSDAAYLAPVAKTLMLGPGSILNAHTEKEFVTLQELHRAVSIYRNLISELAE